MNVVFVRRGGRQTQGCAIVLDANANLHTGERAFKSIFGTPTSLESDLLLIGAAVFAADRCIARGEREEFARGIELRIPVINIGLLQPFVARLELLLRKLSHDGWRIDLRQSQGDIENEFRVNASDGKTLLFSGGLDSLAAAIELGKEGNKLQLVSHITRGRHTKQAQENLISLLARMRFRLSHRKFLVSARSTPPGRHLRFDIESSQRTRSFMYLILGALSARRAGHEEIVMIAENGQMAIHLPLTHGRIGAFSTHTAHPEVLSMMEDFLAGVLRYPLRIVNPYIYKTKAEVVKVIWDELPAAIPVTISCWRSERLPSDATHCGECIPCLVRRIAIESHGGDPTTYNRNLLIESVAALDPDDQGRRNLADLAEFVVRIENGSEIDIMDQWPELHSAYINPGNVIAMYKRAASEARNALSRYRNLAPLLT